MKHAAVLILIGLSLAVAMLLHSYKIERPHGDIDKLKAGLRGVEKYMPKNAHIGWMGDNDIFQRVRYILAPRFLDLKNTTADTLLVIKHINDTPIVSGKIIWQNADDTHQYFLVTR